MRKLLISFVVALVASCVYAQNAQVKDTRQTYLWDVTLSMKGKAAGCPDIWDKVKSSMIDDIMQISDERIEIVVIPFQHKALDVWTEFATPAGKDRLVNRIKKYQLPLFEFNGRMTTMTDLSAPLLYCVNNILSEDKTDILKLMTDGVSDINQDRYEDLLRRWCGIAKQKDAYGFYIMLTDAAKEGLTTLKQIDPCRFEPVDVSQMEGATVSILALAPQPSYAFNVRDDYGKDITLKFSPSGNGMVPPGYRVHVYAHENNYIQFDDVVEMGSDYSVTVKPVYTMGKAQMMAILPVDRNEMLSFRAEPADGMDKMPYATTQILDCYTTCEMINKPEKTLKFHVN
ncbi:MAG: hypothetical protein K2J62_02890 [Bacteroidales bacterium]|nr:hypothetical protein [Bacteroidales bacterium]